MSTSRSAMWCRTLALSLSLGLPGNRNARFDSLVVRIYGTAAVVTGTVVVTDDATQTASRDSFTDVFALRHHR